MNLYGSITKNLKEAETKEEAKKKSKLLRENSMIKSKKPIQEKIEIEIEDEEKEETPEVVTDEVVTEETPIVEDTPVIEPVVEEVVVDEVITEEPIVDTPELEEVVEEEDLDIEEKALLGIEDILTKILEKIGGMDVTEEIKTELTECVNSYKETEIKEYDLEQGNYNVLDLVDKIKEKYQDNPSDLYILIEDMLNMLSEETYDKVLNIVLAEKEEIIEEDLMECEVSSYKVSRRSPKAGAFMIEAETKDGMQYIVGKNYNAESKTLDEAEMFADKNKASLKFKSLVKDNK